MNEDIVSLGLEIENYISLLLQNADVSISKTRLQAHKHQLTDKNKAYTLENLVYGGFLLEAMSMNASLDRSGFRLLQEQIRGERSYTKSYALFNDFREMLSNASSIHHDVLDALTQYYQSAMNSSNVNFTKDDYEEKLSHLYDLVHDGVVPKSLPEYAIQLGSNILLSLPDPPIHSFNIQENTTSFSTIFPKSRDEATSIQIEYINSLLRKLRGEETMFVDIQILPSGYAINLR